jgi:RND family efflux transporter MFP subunit
MNKFFIVFALSLTVLACDADTIVPGQTKEAGSPGVVVGQTVEVESQMISQTQSAVGTIRPLTQTRIESQVSGQVLAINVSPSDRVTAGQPLVRLDSRQLTARLEQAKEGLSIAKNAVVQAQKAGEESQAGLDQARAAYLRTKTLFEKDVVPSQQLEIDRAAYLQAKARVAQSQEKIQAARTGIRKAKEVVKEAQIGLEYADIRSPAAGVVVQRLVDPGDIAVPGKSLLVIQTSGSLRLEARVREGLIHKVIQGHTYEVKIQTLGKAVEATIEEIVPYADPDTRTFLVKAALPETPGVFPGMFGRLRIPLDQEKTLLIPREAVIRVGQLEMVNVKSRDGAFHSVYIKTGQAYGDKIEVLAGLNDSETIGY